MAAFAAPVFLGFFFLGVILKGVILDRSPGEQARSCGERDSRSPGEQDACSGDEGELSCSRSERGWLYLAMFSGQISVRIM